MDNLFPPSLQLNINNIFQVGSVLFGNMLTFQIPSFAISKNSYFYRIMTVFRLIASMVSSNLFSLFLSILSKRSVCIAESGQIFHKITPAFLK